MTATENTGLEDPRENDRVVPLSADKRICKSSLWEAAEAHLVVL